MSQGPEVGLDWLRDHPKRRLPKGEGRGVQKMPQKEMFTSRFEETRGGMVSQKSKLWEDVFYGWSLILNSTSKKKP